MSPQPKAPIIDFVPPVWAKGAHAQTVLGHLLNRPKGPTSTTARQVDLPDGDALVMLEDAPNDAPRAAVLLMHGLGGDANARYMVSAANGLRTLGCVTYRLNQRGAGEGAGRAKRTYHSGRTEDAGAAVRWVARRHPGLPLIAVGYSMSGNILLKYLGETASTSGLAGAVAVNPPVDLAQCIAALERRENRFYHRRFTKLLQTLLENNATRSTEPPVVTSTNARSVREFDTAVTAPSWGFESAEHYYDVESARHVVHHIVTPTWVITTADDPFVPVSTFHELSWPDAVRLHIADRGGHMGYVARRPTPSGNRRWLDYAILAITEKFADSWTTS